MSAPAAVTASAAPSTQRGPLRSYQMPESTEPLAITSELALRMAPMRVCDKLNSTSKLLMSAGKSPTPTSPIKKK